MSEQEFKKARQVAKRKSNRTITTSPCSWFHLGHAGDIYICNQQFGQKAGGHVRLTRAEFEQFVRFYETGYAAHARKGVRTE